MPLMLTNTQENKGYQVESAGNYVLIWHHNNQIGLLLKTPDIAKRVRALVEKHQQEFERAMAGS